MIRSLGLMLLLAGCTKSVEITAGAAEDPALMTALFLDARAIEPQLADDFACAGVESAGIEEDPPSTVLNSLRNRLKTRVFAQSACRRDEKTSLVAVEGESGRGTWLTVGDISCTDQRLCSATVSYYVANQGAGGREVVAERTAAGWRVTPSGRMWVS